MRERWARRMSTLRLGSAELDRFQARSAWQRDHDRVLFSGPFRRLADKTQVFPLPFDDHVHSRLTHSLEVATIGRSLGSRVGAELSERGHLPEGLSARDLGDCVAAACLAHDLGNPPFGHIGEQAIQEFFSRNQCLLTDLTEHEREDLLRFEGNAQGFRTVIQPEFPWRSHGLDLTVSTLGAFMKYPCSVGARSKDLGKSRRKHGVMAADAAAWTRVADELQLPIRAGAEEARARHPLAFLTEAADDVAYLLLDLEDGFRLKHVTEGELREVLEPLAQLPHDHPALTGKSLQRAESIDRAAFLRGRAIDTLVGQLAEGFLAHEREILDGGFDEALREHIQAASGLRGIEELCFRRCYRARDVLKMELTGAEAIQGLLQFFTSALTEPEALRTKHLRALYGDIVAIKGSRYEQLVRITDHVAGMTDHYAVRLYRELRGVRYPGGRD